MYKRKEDGVIFPWLEKNLDKNKTVIDIGARKGNWYRNIFLKNKTREAHLFEAIPSIASTTRSRYKKDKDVTVHTIALSNYKGESSFFVDLDQGGWSGLTKQKDSGRYQEIIAQVDKLDNFNFSNIGLIKIDVEGNELNTMQGCEKTIKDNNPLIYFECADVHMKNYDYDSGDIFNYLSSLEYKIYDLDFALLDKNAFKNKTASNSSFYHNFIASFTFL
jgi:FkbM family methyltransferase